MVVAAWDISLWHTDFSCELSSCGVQAPKFKGSVVAAKDLVATGHVGSYIHVPCNARGYSTTGPPNVPPKLFHHSKQNLCTPLCACFCGCFFSLEYGDPCTGRVLPGQSHLVKFSSPELLSSQDCHEFFLCKQYWYFCPTYAYLCQQRQVFDHTISKLSA